MLAVTKGYVSEAFFVSVIREFVALSKALQGVPQKRERLATSWQEALVYVIDKHHIRIEEV